eukprot:6758856-Lingulodinium_polyedra.AAC.1
MLTGKITGPRLAASANSANVTGPAMKLGASSFATSPSESESWPPPSPLLAAMPDAHNGCHNHDH